MAQQPERGSRERFVRAANRLLASKGYAATGLKEVAAAGAAPIGSLYFHFPAGKEELAVAAMSHGAAEFTAVLDEALGGRAELPASYARVAKLVAERMAAADWDRGCPVAPTALETAGTSPALRDAAAAAFAAWESRLARRAMDAGLSRARAEALAGTALALLEGAELMARVQRSPTPLLRAARALRVLAADALVQSR